MNEETAVLLGALESQRAHVLGAARALSADQLRAPALPSAWTCVGLVNHLAVDVERFWFRAVMAGDENVWETFRNAGGSAWQVDEHVPAADVLALYEDEVRAANDVIAAMSLDTPPAAWPEDQFGDFRLPNLRAVLLHVITETACHAGHLDAAREILDGKQWIVLD